MSQWTHLLENLGIWEGSFSYFSSEGIETSSIPSRVSLEGLYDNQQICQTVQMLSADRTTVISERVLNYQALSRSVLVFKTGAFSQGSMQYGPFSEFGAELGFKWGDRRCRLVQLFDKDANLSTFTLIRECRKGTDTDDIHWANQHPLSVETCIGEWSGTAITLYADLSPAQTTATYTRYQWQGDRLIETSEYASQSINRHWQPQTSTQASFAKPSPTASRATVVFDTEHKAHQWRTILFPGGMASITPRIIPKRQAFHLEAVWYVSGIHRQCMMRHYNAFGEWTALTLTDEHKEGG
jgi:hypothetical protein